MRHQIHFAGGAFYLNRAEGGPKDEEDRGTFQPPGMTGPDWDNSVKEESFSDVLLDRGTGHYWEMERFGHGFFKKERLVHILSISDPDNGGGLSLVLID